MQGGTYAYTETVEDNSLQVRTWSLARTVKFISIIDIIFMGITGFILGYVIKKDK